MPEKLFRIDDLLVEKATVNYRRLLDVNFSVVMNLGEVDLLSNFSGDAGEIDERDVLAGGEDEFAIAVSIGRLF